MTTRAGTIALVVASMLWGTTGTAASFLPANVSPLAIGASTMGLGGLLLFAWTMRGSVAAVRDTSARRWLFIGAIGVVVYPLAFYSAMDLAGVAIGNVVALGSGPVFAAVFEWIVERRRISRRWVVSTVIAVAGILLLSFGGAGAGDRAQGGEVPGVLPGVLLGLAAGAAYALYTYAAGRAMTFDHGSSAVMGGMFGLGSVVLVPVLVVTGAPLLQSASTIAIGAYLVVGPMFIAYLMFGIGVRVLRSSAVTTITLIEPVVATLLAVLVVGERLGLVGWVGLALILAGVTLVSTARQPRI